MFRGDEGRHAAAESVLAAMEIRIFGGLSHNGDSPLLMVIFYHFLNYQKGQLQAHYPPL